MTRRGVSAMLLALVAVQLLGTIAFASVCFEPCPDDTEESSCPPVCSLCTSCTHAQSAVVQPVSEAVPVISTYAFLAQQESSTASQLAADIFHIPLLG